MNLFAIQSYLKFLLKSSNEHGVHSPFVFKILTKCFYAKDKKKLSNSMKNYGDILSLKLYKYLNASSVLEINSEDFIFDKKNMSATNIRIDKHTLIKDINTAISNKKYDFAYINTTKYTSLPVEEYIQYFNTHTHNDSVVVFNNIHRTKKSYKIWREISANKNITVSIDVFYAGILFFRKEQQKEHFIIRAKSILPM